MIGASAAWPPTRAQRVLICGSRPWTDRACVQAVVRQLPLGSVVIIGGATGADALAAMAARAAGLECEVYPADWARYGRRAGPIRNRQMLREGRPEVVVAFHPDLWGWRGTADMVRVAQAAGLPVWVVRDRDSGVEKL